jgi:hypothetical protein
MAREVLEAQAMMAEDPTLDTEVQTPGELLLRSEGARGIRRRRQRLRHPGDRPLGHPQSTLAADGDNAEQVLDTLAELLTTDHDEN